MYCKTAWNGIFILPDGYIRLCSLGRYEDASLDFQRARDKFGNPMHILTHDLHEIINSDKHREIRLLNKENPNAWSPHCDCCEVREKTDTEHTNPSRRIFLHNVKTSHVDNKNAFNYLDHDGIVPWLPSTLDINFGNLCNQKCIMCNPAFSNQWYNEWFDYWKTDSFGQSSLVKATFDQSLKKWKDPDILKWHETEVWWNKFDQMAPYLRHIYVTGGEPMVTPSHDKMLDKLIENDFAKDIWLEYDTNCSVINSKIIDRWKKFKKVSVRASMDGIKEKYHLIRYPGNWKKFDENIKIFKELEKESNRKISLSAITSCFQISNCFDQEESENYCKKISVPYHIRFLEGPMYMSTESFNQQSKKELIEFYQKSNFTKSNMIINYFLLRMESSKPDRIYEYIKFMDYLDSTRKTNWRETFPLLNDMINRNY